MKVQEEGVLFSLYCEFVHVFVSIGIAYDFSSCNYQRQHLCPQFKIQNSIHSSARKKVGKVQKIFMVQLLSFLYVVVQES